MATLHRKPFDSGASRHEAVVGYFFISPWIVGFCVFWLWPLLYALWLSFTDAQLMRETSFVGLANYEAIFFEDRVFWDSFWVTVRLMAIYVPLAILLSFLLALLLSTDRWGTKLFRACVFLPSLTPVIAASMLWLWIFSPAFGLLNYYLGLLGLPTREWVGQRDWATAAIVIVLLWLNIGGTRMLIFLAGLKDIPKELYEAARIDGASAWQRFFRITLPLLTPVIFLNIVISIIYAFQVFALAYSLTDGGPINETLYYVLYLYRTAFEYLKFGYAGALSWILFIIILVFTAIQFWLANRWVYTSRE